MCIRDSVHAVDARGVFEGDDVGAVLIEPDEIAAVLVEKGEMRGHDYLFRPYAAPVGDGRGADELAHGRVLVGVQAPRDGGDEAERVELRLARHAHGPGHGKGEGQLGRELRRSAQTPERRGLALGLPAVGERVGKGVPLRKAAVDVPAEPAVLLQRRLVGLEVLPRALRAEHAYKFIIDKAVLGGYFCRRVLCDAAAKRFRLHQRVGHARAP